jgi:signal transduction histidine kinase
VNICQLAREVFDRSASLAQQRGIDFTFEAPGEIMGEWDSTRLEQVFSNLLSNAIKYGEGAPVSMKVSLKDKETVTVIVADQGPGISESMQSRIFERFERAGHDHNISGLGLGLYITRQIVRAHGGEIKVRSAPGKGSDFIITLPRFGEDSGSEMIPHSDSG